MAPRTALGTLKSSPDFRVLSFQPQNGQILDRSYQRRLPHQKSREGCMACKIKRVKCDETKPNCRRCIRNDRQCQYIQQAEEAKADKTKSLVVLCRAPNNQIIHPSLNNLYNEYGYGDKSFGDVSNGTLLSHFQHVFPELQLFGMANIDQLLPLGTFSPYLLNAILAVSASHIRLHVSQKQPSRIAEHLHQGLAIKGFKVALQQNINQQSSDGLIITCMFLSVLAFSFMEDDDPRNSWLFQNGPHRLGWLSVNLGLKPLLLATLRYRDNSILSSLFEASDDDKGTFYGEEKSLDCFPAHWQQLLKLGLDPVTDEIFYEPARIINTLVKLEPTADSFFLYLNFIGSMDIDFKFRNLLELNDERAIWILGYWMGLMCRYNHWWIKARVTSEWHATCIWFNNRRVVERPGKEGQMWQLLMNDLQIAPHWSSGVECDFTVEPGQYLSSFPFTANMDIIDTTS